MPAGFRIETLASVGSSNDIVRERAAAGEPEGLVVRALEQRQGRGRLGRSWVSPPGNLYASLLLRPRRPTFEAATLSLVTGLSLAAALCASFPALPAIALKWPNDVLVGGAKLAGILLESVGDEERPAVVAGMGVNVASAPSGLAYATTSLAAHGIAIDPGDLLASFLDRFAADYARWQWHGFEGLRDDWLAMAAGVGATARIRDGDHVLEGRFVTVDAAGCLVLDMAVGRRRLAAGELFFPALAEKEAACSS